MIIENNSLEDRETIIKVDTDCQIITINKSDESNEIPFNKVSYLVHNVGQIIWEKDYVEFRCKNKTAFSILINQEQIKELEKFFNIRTEILVKTEPIKKSHKYWLQVSEPWDFRANLFGDNKILGTVIDVNEKRIIFKSDFRINVQNVCGNVFMLRPRYCGDKCNRSPLTVNGAILLTKYDPAKTDEQLSENSKFVIIGSLKKCFNKNVFTNISTLFWLLCHYIATLFLYFIVIIFTIMIFKSIFDIFMIFVA